MKRRDPPVSVKPHLQLVYDALPHPPEFDPTLAQVLGWRCAGLGVAAWYPGVTAAARAAAYRAWRKRMGFAVQPVKEKKL
jgi:hypothetical protein